MGIYKINGIDISTFGLFVRPGGSDGFLALPKPKKGYQYDWQGESGVEINPLEPVVFEARSVAVPMTIAATTEQAFWSGYTAFVQELSKQGLQEWHIGEFRRSFRVKLENFSNLDRLTRILNPTQPVVANFTITLLEPNPNLFFEAPTDSGTPVPSDQLTYFWGYSGAPVHGTDYDALAFQFTGNRSRTNPVLDFSANGNYKYLYMATPLEAPVFGEWENTDKNYGKFPDQVFHAPFEHNGKRLYISRSAVLLDKNITSLELS